MWFMPDEVYGFLSENMGICGLCLWGYIGLDLEFGGILGAEF
jgi:hypothetical protein